MFSVITASHNLLAYGTLEYLLCFVLMVNFKGGIGETLYHKQCGPHGREENMHTFQGIPSLGLFNMDLLRL